MSIRWGIFGMGLLIFALLLGCSSYSRTSIRNETGRTVSTTPTRVYEPRFFVYRNGRYTFVKGHYRRVWSPRAYHRRSLQGYCLKKGEVASARND